MPTRSGRAEATSKIATSLARIENFMADVERMSVCNFTPTTPSHRNSGAFWPWFFGSAFAAKRQVPCKLHAIFPELHHGTAHSRLHQNVDSPRNDFAGPPAGARHAVSLPRRAGRENVFARKL